MLSGTINKKTKLYNSKKLLSMLSISNKKNFAYQVYGSQGTDR